jgi:hypothetical protein
VKDEPEVRIQPKGDSLADPPELANLAAFGGGEGWVSGAEQKRAGKANVFKGLAEDAGLERGEICRDVGELGHGGQSARRDEELARGLLRGLEGYFG